MVKKGISVLMIVSGAILLLVGLFMKIPSKELTTYSLLEDKYSVIEEYVGGDAYNYMIGASLVGGEIAGAKTQKAIYISAGLSLLCLGLYTLALALETTAPMKKPLALPACQSRMEACCNDSATDMDRENETETTSF